jgi:hypothetical protein
MRNTVIYEGLLFADGFEVPASSAAMRYLKQEM